MKPYYEDASCTIWHADCREVLPWMVAEREDAVLLTDPPYGISYSSGRPRVEGNARSIKGDADTSVRDFVLEWWGDGPALVFGSWRVSKRSRLCAACSALVAALNRARG